MSVQEIESTIAKLPPEQLVALGEWFDEYRADEWDRQIEADAKVGRLDSLIRRRRPTSQRVGLARFLRHRTTAGSWKRFEAQPEAVQKLTRKNYRC